LFYLHPRNLKISQYASTWKKQKVIQTWMETYLDNCLAEARRWYKLSKISTSSINAGSLDFLYVHSDSFCPWVRDSLCICLYFLWRLAQMKASASPLDNSRHGCCQPPWLLDACVLMHHVFTRNQSRK
jgi:hypothetical protein